MRKPGTMPGRGGKSRRFVRAMIVPGTLAILTSAGSLTARDEPVGLVPGHTFRDWADAGALQECRDLDLVWRDGTRDVGPVVNGERSGSPQTEKE